MCNLCDIPFAPNLPQPLLIAFDPADPATWSAELSPDDKAAFIEICADRTLFLLHIVRKHVQLESTRYPGRSDKQILLESGKFLKKILLESSIETPEALGKLIDKCFEYNYIHMRSICDENYSGILQQLFNFIVLKRRFKYYICRTPVCEM